MSMLAETRRKKQYILQPRGKPLYEDDLRFGSKMLKKMGWSKGKGLGASESGNTEFVRVNFKNNAAGLGFENRDDQWTQHEEGFNGLLQSLQSQNNSESSNEDEIEEIRPAFGFGFKDTKKQQDIKKAISGESLEQKSKQSRARVHYKKFTRGKDISQYSEKDLANIFGKKALNEEKAGQEDPILENSSTSMTDYFRQKINKKKRAIEDELNSSEESKQEDSILQTSTTSISDYFKQKMCARKNKSLAVKNVDGSSESSNSFAFSESNPNEKINGIDLTYEPFPKCTNNLNEISKNSHDGTGKKKVTQNKTENKPQAITRKHDQNSTEDSSDSSSASSCYSDSEDDSSRSINNNIQKAEDINISKSVMKLATENFKSKDTKLKLKKKQGEKKPVESNSSSDLDDFVKEKSSESVPILSQQLKTRKKVASIDPSNSSDNSDEEKSLKSLPPAESPKLLKGSTEKTNKHESFHSDDLNDKKSQVEKQNEKSSSENSSASVENFRLDCKNRKRKHQSKHVGIDKKSQAIDTINKTTPALILTQLSKKQKGDYSSESSGSESSMRLKQNKDRQILVTKAQAKADTKEPRESSDSDGPTDSNGNDKNQKKSLPDHKEKAKNCQKLGKQSRSLTAPSQQAKKLDANSFAYSNSCYLEKHENKTAHNNIKQSIPYPATKPKNQQVGSKDSSVDFSNETIFEKSGKTEKTNQDEVLTMSSKNNNSLLSPDNNDNPSLSTIPDITLHTDLKSLCEQFNSYEISAFCAEKFRRLDCSAFRGSSLEHQIGYSFDKNMKLNINCTDLHDKRILDFWSGTLSKYNKGNKNKKSKATTEAKDGANDLKNTNVRDSSKPINTKKKFIAKSRRRRNAFKLGI